MLRILKVISCILLIILIFCSSLLATPVSQAQTGEGVLVLDEETGRTIFEQNADIPLAPASTTKLMTAILIAKKCKLSDSVVVGNEVVGVEGASLGLSPGDRISVEDLLYALLLPSANEAATALAAYASGSVDQFVAEMNKQALSMGLTTTRFVNPNGLPAVGHVTTAREMATIANLAIKEPAIRNMMNSKEREIAWRHGNSTVKVRLENTNKFLGVYPGVKGMKTGTTTEAGQCLVTYAEWNCGKVLMVVLNSTNRYVDTRQYLDQAYKELQQRKAGRTLVEKLPIGF